MVRLLSLSDDEYSLRKFQGKPRISKRSSRKTGLTAWS